LGKQAKTLSKGQVDAVLGYLAKTRWPTRNRVILLLSVKAGLRAKEIACLTWRMVTDARGQMGQAIHLEDAASKGRSGRVIPMNEELRTRTALREYAETVWMPTSTFLIQSERSRGMSPQHLNHSDLDAFRPHKLRRHITREQDAFGIIVIKANVASSFWRTNSLCSHDNLQGR
jgi:site-specific recombinase XerD